MSTCSHGDFHFDFIFIFEEHFLGTVQVDEEENDDETEDELDFDQNMDFMAFDHSFEDTCFPGFEDGQVEEEEEDHLCQHEEEEDYIDQFKHY